MATRDIETKASLAGLGCLQDKKATRRFTGQRDTPSLGPLANKRWCSLVGEDVTPLPMTSRRVLTTFF